MDFGKFIFCEKIIQKPFPKTEKICSTFMSTCLRDRSVATKCLSPLLNDRTASSARVFRKREQSHQQHLLTFLLLIYAHFWSAGDKVHQRWQRLMREFQFSVGFSLVGSMEHFAKRDPSARWHRWSGWQLWLRVLSIKGNWQPSR